MGTPSWKSHDGRVTPIDMMDTKHLINTVKLIHRDGSVEAMMLPHLEKEMIKRGFEVELKMIKSGHNKYGNYKSRRKWN